MTGTALAREAAAIEVRLVPLGTARRAAGAKAYLKSDLRFLGNDTATLRQAARAWRTAHADWDVDELCGLAEAAKADPARVVAFVEPRAGRLSGVTWREATRTLAAPVRKRLDARRAASGR